MRDRVFFFGIGMVVTLALLPAKGFSQTPGTQNRIPQQIVVNGQMASGAFVTTAGGQLQSFTCPTPQHYTTADGTSQGWACYEQTTGVWLLNALPPAPAQAPTAPQPAPQPPPVVYQQAPPQVYQQAPQVVYAPPPAVVYQPAPAVIYQQPYPTVVYSQPYPTVVYAPAPRPVVVAPVYPSSVILGSAAINAAGRIASAVILNSHRGYYYYGGGRRW
jgi:hypothetical protein